MKSGMMPALVVAGVLAVSGGGWLLLPSLQDEQITVDAQASEQLERARRLLHQYSTGLTYKSLLLDQLRELGLDMDVMDVDAWRDAGSDEYQRYLSDAWQRYQPMDWQADPPRPARVQLANLEGQIKAATNQRRSLVTDNRELLDRALETVNEALSYRLKNASTASHAEAARLKSTILYHMGLRQWLQTGARRRDADAYRQELLALADRAASDNIIKTLVADSGVNDQLQILEAHVNEVRKRTTQSRAALTVLDTTVADLEERLAAAESRAANARQSLEELQAGGAESTDYRVGHLPNGAEAFRLRVGEHDQIYREALREAHVLKFGDYTDAHIDHTGDYLTGQYVPREAGRDLTTRFGLAHYRNERSVLAASVEQNQQAINDLGSAITRLEGMRNASQETQDRALQRIADGGLAAITAYAELNRIESEAFAIEEAALEVLERSARFARQAAGSARQWTTEARQRAQELPLRAKERSAAETRSQGTWMAGYIAAQEADARLAKAWINVDRYDAYRENAQILDHIRSSLELPEADAESERLKAAEARDAGVQEIDQALAVLEGVHRTVGRHWTITAQAAGAIYLRALLGHQSYKAHAIEAYRQAVKGREDKPYAEKIVSRLKRLENR